MSPLIFRKFNDEIVLDMLEGVCKRIHIYKICSSVVERVVVDVVTYLFAWSSCDKPVH